MCNFSNSILLRVKFLELLSRIKLQAGYQCHSLYYTLNLNRENSSEFQRIAAIISLIVKVAHLSG